MAAAVFGATASRPAVAYAPVSNVRMVATNNNQYTAEAAQYTYETWPPMPPSRFPS